MYKWCHRGLLGMHAYSRAQCDRCVTPLTPLTTLLAPLQGNTHAPVCNTNSGGSSSSNRGHILQSPSNNAAEVGNVLCDLCITGCPVTLTNAHPSPAAACLLVCCSTTGWIHVMLYSYVTLCIRYAYPEPVAADQHNHAVSIVRSLQAEGAARSITELLVVGNKGDVITIL